MRAVADGLAVRLLRVDPEEDLIAVLMTQHYPFSFAVLPRFRVLVYAAIDD